MTPELAVRAPNRALAEALGVVAVLLAAMTVPGFVIYLGWAQERQIRAAWEISGPPCPESVQPLAAVFRKPKTFEYGGARFTRRYGHVDCMPFVERSLTGRRIRRVCQFSAPGAVAVTVGGATTLYRPGVGRPATVTVRDGRASCVMGGWFTG